MSHSQSARNVQHSLFLLILFLVTISLALLALVVPYLAPFSSPSTQNGQVAQQDILAPRDITYTSQVLTEQQRQNAAGAISDIYTPVDTSIARRQLESLRAALAYITSVRADVYAATEQKMADLAALENIRLDQETAASILGLSDSRWQAVQQEAIVVLEQVMRNPIRENQLEEARRTIPNLVSLSLSESQADIVAEIVSAYVAPNSFYSESLTEAARQEASQAIEPVTRSYKAGETVVQRGQVIRETDLEAMQIMGLVQPNYGWKELVSATALVLLMVSFLGFYLWRYTQLYQDMRGLTLIASLFLIFLSVGRLVFPANSVIPYIFPLAAYSLIIAVLFKAELSMISTLPLVILTTYGLPNSLELIIYYTLGGYFGILALGRASRITSFFAAGAVIAASGAVIATIYHLPQPATDWRSLATYSGAAVLNGIASASLTVLLQFFLAQFLGMTTALQLMEITRPDHKLLQLLLRNAPGTYQHSLQVANLAEQAAENIGADTLLTRVGALYHDVGKVLNPAFFIENQAPGSLNPHDEMDPKTSAQVIISHVTDGLELARKHRLPVRIQDFILEHHGTMITRYQYISAVKAAGGDESQVDMEAFRYPGPRPQSRETAILMLADGSEARVRAERPGNVDELKELIKSVIQNRMNSGQLDGTDLTLNDLEAISDSFATTLRGIYHPRIEYPQLETATAVIADSEPTRPSSSRSESPATTQADPTT